METSTVAILTTYAALGAAIHAADARWGLPARARLVDLCSPEPRPTTAGLLSGRTASYQLLFSLGAAHLLTLCAILWAHARWYQAPAWAVAGALSMFTGILIARLRPWSLLPQIHRAPAEALLLLRCTALSMRATVQRRMPARRAPADPARERQARIDRMDELLRR